MASKEKILRAMIGRIADLENAVITDIEWAQKLVDKYDMTVEEACRLTALFKDFVELVDLGDRIEEKYRLVER